MASKREKRHLTKALHILRALKYKEGITSKQRNDAHNELARLICMVRGESIGEAQNVPPDSR